MREQSNGMKQKDDDAVSEPEVTFEEILALEE